MLLLTLLSFLSNPVRASDCIGRDLDPDKYTIKTGLGRTYEEALNGALIGVERRTEATSTVSLELGRIGSLNANYEKFMSSFKAVWIDNFVVRSCHEGKDVRVTALFPKGSVSYDVLPPEFTISNLKKLDEGFGVTIWTFRYPKNIKITAPRKICNMIAGYFVCAFAMHGVQEVVAETSRGSKLTIEPEDAKVRGQFTGWVYNGAFIDVSESVVMELLRRADGKSGIGAVRSITYDQLD